MNIRCLEFVNGVQCVAKYRFVFHCHIRWVLVVSSCTNRGNLSVLSLPTPSIRVSLQENDLHLSSGSSVKQELLCMHGGQLLWNVILASCKRSMPWKRAWRLTNAQSSSPWVETKTHYQWKAFSDIQEFLCYIIIPISYFLPRRT